MGKASENREMRGVFMKKISGAAVCYGVSVLMVLGFVVKTIIDYSRYNSTLNSAPFSVWILANAIYFGVPAIIGLVGGLIVKNRIKKS